MAQEPSTMIHRSDRHHVFSRRLLEAMGLGTIASMAVAGLACRGNVVAGGPSGTGTGGGSGRVCQAADAPCGNDSDCCEGFCYGGQCGTGCSCTPSTSSLLCTYSSSMGDLSTWECAEAGMPCCEDAGICSEDGGPPGICTLITINGTCDGPLCP
jgi:hypothetical protein